MKTITINKTIAQLSHDDCDVLLTPTELVVFLRIANAGGKGVTRDSLARAMYENDVILTDTNLVSGHIKNVRRKLEEIGIDGKSAILTVHGFGYRFNTAQFELVSALSGERAEIEHLADMPHVTEWVTRACAYIKATTALDVDPRFHEAASILLSMPVAKAMDENLGARKR